MISKPIHKYRESKPTISKKRRYLNDITGPAPAILDCVRVSVQQARGVWGHAPPGNLLKLGTLRSLLRPCLGQKNY